MPEILARIPEEVNTYYEPFLGGGAVLLALLEVYARPRRVFASDANPILISTWIAMQQQVEEVIDCLQQIQENQQHLGQRLPLLLPSLFQIRHQRRCLLLGGC